MKKKIFLSLLVAFVLLLTCAGSSASNNIGLYVNGTQLSPDVPPQIINGRTMVPIRFVAEALGTQVTWNETTNSVLIDNKKPASTLPIIEGTDEFREIIEDVLNLAKEKDDALYNWYISNTNKIEIGYVGDAAAMNTINYFTGQTTITFDKDYFDIVKAKYSKRDLILLHAGILAHECEHTAHYNNYIYTHADIEALCWLASVRAFEKVGGNNAEFEKFFKDSVYDQLKL
jgi:hypothetical protein